MTKRLILIRHAKSGWGDPGKSDHERTLTARGEASAARIGKWLLRKKYLPDVILCSDAMRTRQTCNILSAELSNAPEIRFVRSLYHASPDTMLSAAQGEASDCIAMIGHNPGIAMLAHGLVGTPPSHGRFDDYPTAATAVIDFPDTIALHMGSCTDFTVPRDLNDEGAPQ